MQLTRYSQAFLHSSAQPHQGVTRLPRLVDPQLLEGTTVNFQPLLDPSCLAFTFSMVGAPTNLPRAQDPPEHDTRPPLQRLTQLNNHRHLTKPETYSPEQSETRPRMDLAHEEQQFEHTSLACHGSSTRSTAPEGI